MEPTQQPSHPAWLRAGSEVLREAAASGAGSAQNLGFEGARAVRHDLIFTQLHVRGMAWSERTYARFGLSFADPFSDRNLVDLVLAMPQAAINRPGVLSKPLMRRAMRSVVPESARGRLAKVVPTPLYERSLETDAQPVVRELLRAPLVAQHGWVDAELWRTEYDRWRAGDGSLSAEWWWTLGIETWLRAHWS